MRRTQLRQSEVVVDTSLIFHVLMMSDVQKGLLPAVSSISVLYPKICNPVPLKKNEKTIIWKHKALFWKHEFAPLARRRQFCLLSAYKKKSGQVLRQGK